VPTSKATSSSIEFATPKERKIPIKKEEHDFPGLTSTLPIRSSTVKKSPIKKSSVKKTTESPKSIMKGYNGKNKGSATQVKWSEKVEEVVDSDEVEEDNESGEFEDSFDKDYRPHIKKKRVI
jgi:hypothetical protein